MNGQLFKLQQVMMFKPNSGVKVSWPVVSDAQSAIQLAMCIGCLLMGLSHLVQPEMWQRYFATLHQQGVVGVVTRTMFFELWPAIVIVTLHQVWHGPGIILTLYGWLALAKCAISLLAPQVGVRSLGLAQGSRSFAIAGSFLIAVSFSSGLALLWR